MQTHSLTAYDLNEILSDCFRSEVPLITLVPEDTVQLITFTNLVTNQRVTIPNCYSIDFDLSDYGSSYVWYTDLKSKFEVYRITDFTIEDSDLLDYLENVCN